MSTTRPTICFTLDSRSGEERRPRKYFCATMFVAVWDQNFGNSTPRCSNVGPVAARDDRVAQLPLDLVERVAAGDGEEPAHAEACGLVHDGIDHLFGGLVRRSECGLRRHAGLPNFSGRLHSTGVFPGVSPVSLPEAPIPGYRGTAQSRRGAGRNPAAGASCRLSACCRRRGTGTGVLASPALAGPRACAPAATSKRRARPPSTSSGSGIDWALLGENGAEDAAARPRGGRRGRVRCSESSRRPTGRSRGRTGRRPGSGRRCRGPGGSRRAAPAGCRRSRSSSS